MIRILEAMKNYTILRTTSKSSTFTKLGVVRASNKIEAIKKMIQSKKPRKGYFYIALSDSDFKFVGQYTAEGIVKRGKGKI